jgi:hypothetical protein
VAAQRDELFCLDPRAALEHLGDRGLEVVVVLCPARLCGRGDRSHVITAANAPAVAISGT